MQHDQCRAVKRWFVGLTVRCGSRCCPKSFREDLFVNNSGTPPCSDNTTYANNDALHPWCALTQATASAIAGDVVLVTAGTYSAPGAGVRYTPAFNPANNGAPGNPITFRAVGAVHLTLSSGTGPVFGAGDRSYITWDGFIADEHDHAVYDGEPHLAVGWGADHIVIQNCVFIGQYLPEDGRNHSAIRFEGASSCLVRNNLFYGFTGSERIIPTCICIPAKTSP